MSQHVGEKTTIGAHEYEMFMLPPRKSQSLFIKAFKMVTPTLGQLLDSVAPRGLAALLEQDINGEFFSKASKEIRDGLDDKLVEEIQNAMMEVTIVDGKMNLKDVFDEIFRGSLDELFRWTFWGARVQWGKLFGALASERLGQGAKPPAP